MPVASSVAPALGGLPVSFLVVLAIAVAALVCIGITVRRLRLADTLTVANASTNAAAAGLVLAAALLASVAIGAASPAVAAVPPATPAYSNPAYSNQQPDGFQPVVIEDLEGYQLPTK
jgi:hypothetical protein